MGFTDLHDIANIILTVPGCNCQILHWALGASWCRAGCGCRELLNDEGTDAIECSSPSCDLNTINQLWDIMYHCIQQY